MSRIAKRVSGRMRESGARCYLSMLDCDNCELLLNLKCTMRRWFWHEGETYVD